MKHCYFFILFFVFYQSAYSMPRPVLMIGEIAGKSLIAPNFSREMQKTLVRVASNQSEYELVIGSGINPDPKLNVFVIKSSITKLDAYFRLITELYDNKKNKLIRTFTVEKVPQEDLIRMYEAILVALFTKEPKTGPLPPKPKEKSKKELSLELQTNPPDSSAINFKKIIESLKMGSNQAVEMAINAPEPQQEIIEGQEDQNKNPASPKKINSNNESTLKSSSTVSNSDMVRLHRGLPGNMLLSLGWENRENSNKNILSTTSSAKSMVFNFSTYKPLHSTNGYVSIGSENSINYIIDFPYEVSIPYQASLFSQFHLFKDQIRGSLGVKRDQGFYVNLIGPGEGLKAFDIVTDWLQVQISALFYKSEIKITLNNLFKGNGNNKLVNTDKMTGSYYQFMFAPPMMIKGWNSYAMFDKMELSSKGAIPFDSQENRFQIGVSTSF